MPYALLPDRRMPYDNDGSQTGAGNLTSGVYQWYSGTELNELQDDDFTFVSISITGGGNFVFFPENREVTAYYWIAKTSNNPADIPSKTVYGSLDSVNGLDGTWETGSQPSGTPTYSTNYDWRSGIKPISFTGPKRVFRCIGGNAGVGSQVHYNNIFHLYGEKAAGQTPDDIIYIDHDTTPGTEYTGPEDFGDQPLGTTVVRQFRIKNTSATKTANTINIQCNDADFAISEDGVVWVVTINIASLSAGAESATLYVRSTTPALGALLGPRFARIVTTVASYT